MCVCVCVFFTPLQWMCFDACPVHACLPFVAERIAAVSPNAKIIIMVRVAYSNPAESYHLTKVLMDVHIGYIHGYMEIYI